MHRSRYQREHFHLVLRKDAVMPRGVQSHGDHSSSRARY
jgi:hypothetical protein